jgi:hypothetical protein
MQSLPALQQIFAILWVGGALRRVFGSHMSGKYSVSRDQRNCWVFGGNLTAKYRVCIKLKETMASLEDRRPVMSVRAPLRTIPELSNFSGSGFLPNRWTWARAGITLTEDACFQGHRHTTSKT